jgi:RES domain-containing protein
MAGGRWNLKGLRVIYASESYGGALVEILVHGNLGRVPRGFASIEIHIPAEVDIEEITSKDLPNWDAQDCLASQSYGSRWYEKMRTAVLVVPSVPGGGIGRNVLLNQDHPKFHLLTASSPQAVKWDRRLFHRLRNK